MQRVVSFQVIALTTLLAVTCECVPAQQGLFGQRTIGRSLTRRASSSQSPAPGTVDQNRRFLRDQRSATEFVGSAPSGGGAAGFVGGQSAVTAAVSSVQGLQEEVRPPLNRPRIIRPTGLYPERLSIDQNLLGKANSQPEQRPSDLRPLSESLQSIMETREVTIEVSPATGSATLRGEVPSEEDRKTTELLVMLEPGIQTIVNDLKVNPNLRPYPTRRARTNLNGSNSNASH